MCFNLRLQHKLYTLCQLSSRRCLVASPRSYSERCRGFLTQIATLAGRMLEYSCPCHELRVRVSFRGMGMRPRSKGLASLFDAFAEMARATKARWDKAEQRLSAIRAAEAEQRKAR